MSDYAVFVGIDVSKDRLDVHLLPQGERFAVSNDGAGAAQLRERLVALGEHALVVMEATNTFWKLSATTLAGAGLSVAVVNPRQVRDFAKASGRLAKTDAIDAHVLALFAQAIRPAVRSLPNEQCEIARELLTRRMQLMNMRSAEKNRLSSARGKKVRKDIEVLIRFLDGRLKGLDEEIDEWLDSTPIDQTRVNLLKSFSGIGQVSARALLIGVPELGSLSGKQVSALVGLAPYARDSGQQRGQRHIGGGRAWVRAALYMPTLTATRCNPVIRAMYQRLIKAGKHHYVAITACMRKVLVILNAMLKSGEPWTAPQTA
jgi:transposase